MKKSVVLLTILLIAAIIGTYAVYELYVKQRMKELGEHLKKEEELRSRIAQLEEGFFRTEPQIVLEEWRRSTQPWADAVEARTEFFNMGPITVDEKVPENRIPKLYYRERLPELKQELQNYAFQKNVQVADFDCGVPPADAYGQGTNPPAAEIEGHLKDYQYCSAVTRMLIDAKPIRIEPLSIWPENQINLRNGVIKERTVGLRWDINVEEFVRFLDRLSQAPRFFRVETVKITKNDLLDAQLPPHVEMVLTQADFVESRKPGAGGAEANIDQQTTNVLNSLFGGGGQTAAPGGLPEEEEESWFQWFRRVVLRF